MPQLGQYGKKRDRNVADGWTGEKWGKGKDWHGTKYDVSVAFGIERF